VLAEYLSDKEQELSLETFVTLSVLKTDSAIRNLWAIWPKPPNPSNQPLNFADWHEWVTKGLCLEGVPRTIEEVERLSVDYSADLHTAIKWATRNLVQGGPVFEERLSETLSMIDEENPDEYGNCFELSEAGRAAGRWLVQLEMGA